MQWNHAILHLLGVESVRPEGRESFATTDGRYLGHFVTTRKLDGYKKWQDFDTRDPYKRLVSKIIQAKDPVVDYMLMELFVCDTHEENWGVLPYPKGLVVADIDCSTMLHRGLHDDSGSFLKQELQRIVTSSHEVFNIGHVKRFAQRLLRVSEEQAHETAETYISNPKHIKKMYTEMRKEAASLLKQLKDEKDDRRLGSSPLYRRYMAS
jgi:hypothetical protein